MRTRKDRLKKLVKVQEQLKALHETRHARFLAAAAPQRPKPGNWSGISMPPIPSPACFPTSTIAASPTRWPPGSEPGKRQAGGRLIAAATARTNMVERAYKDVRRQDERERSDRERLDFIAQKRGQGSQRRNFCL